MSTNNNDNRDEDFEDIEDEDTTEEDEDTDSDESDEELKDKEDESDEDEEDDKEDTDDKKDTFVIPKKFEGKTVEDVIKAYQNLEGVLDKKAQEKAQEILKNKGMTVKPDANDDDFDIGLTDEEIAKMTPKEFARHMNQKITERATELATKAINSSNETKANVSREIKEATKAHPHLKDNNEYREIVLSIIEAASAKGKIVTLKEACEKADKAMNIKVEEKVEEKKKVKTAVEKNDSGGEGKEKTREDRIKEGMLNAGNSGSYLGGLGI